MLHMSLSYTSQYKKWPVTAIHNKLTLCKLPMYSDTFDKVLKPSLKFHLVIFTQSRTEWRPMTGPPPDPV